MKRPAKLVSEAQSSALMKPARSWIIMGMVPPNDARVSLRRCAAGEEQARELGRRAPAAAPMDTRRPKASPRPLAEG